MTEHHDDANQTASNAEQEYGQPWFRYALTVAGCLFAFRLIYAMIVPIDLVHDEAYYWDWSRNLDWGYYSKPPMIAWLIAAGTSIGSSTFTVRLPAICLGTVGLLLVYALGSRMYSPKVGFWAMVLSAATPGNAAMSLIMTIDAPLMFMWSAALYFVWRYLEDGQYRLWWLAATCVAIGLGLLSKQTMIAFVPLTGLFFIVSARDRFRFAHPSVWLCIIGALAFLTPVIWWNAQHDWITLEHTSGHFSSNSVTLLKRLTRSGEFMLGQFGVASPVTYWLLLSAIVGCCLRFAELGRREKFLLSYTVLPLLGVVALSFTRRVEPNWPAPFYVSALILLASGVSRANFVGKLSSFSSVAYRRAVAVGAILVVIAYLLPFGWGLQGSKLDAVVRLRGWSQLGIAMDEKLREIPQAENSPILVATGRTLASEMAFYMPEQPELFVWNDSGHVVSQYDIWGGPKKSFAKAIILTAHDAEVPESLASQFDQVQLHDTVEVDIGNDRSHRYRIWTGEKVPRIAKQPEQILVSPETTFR